MPVTQLDKGNAFRALHHGPRAFIISNAWDAGSTRTLHFSWAQWGTTVVGLWLLFAPLFF